MVKKVVTIVGARPQFVKASVVSRQFSFLGARAEEVVVHTGQHFDHNMSDIFFTGLQMRAPKYHLDVHGGSHATMTARMMVGIEEVLLAERPDAVLLYGDTNSTLAGALVASKLGMPVAHVEAGLRSFNTSMPEEINRILTDRVSSLLFAPTENAVENLLREGVPASRVYEVGDVMYDAALLYGNEISPSEALEGILGDVTAPYALVTIHRAENTDVVERFRVILRALEMVSSSIRVIWPIHPRSRAVLEREGIWATPPRGVRMCEPVGYVDMVRLEKGAAVIATDSGGVQKEAYFQRVPCATLRDETEWVELVQTGWNRLVPPRDPTSVAKAILDAVGSLGDSISLYGNGTASEAIVRTIIE